MWPRVNARPHREAGDLVDDRDVEPRCEDAAEDRTPSAPPTSRVVSFTAEPTPALGSGRTA